MGIANIELTPDFACKLGASFGGYLKRGATVVTSRDSGPVARMMKRAMISGLLSVGVNIMDLQSTALPIARHTILGSEASGGVHIRLSPTDPRLILIEFFDDQGIYLSKNQERKVETIFFREDFRRVDAEQVGQLDFAGRHVEQYAVDFYQHLKVAEIESRKFKIVADFAFGRLANVFPTMLGKLGCDLIALNAYPDANKAPKTPQDRESLVPNLAQIVQTLRADIGVLFEGDGERMTLVDENGSIIEGSSLLAMMAALRARTCREAHIAVPVTAPRMIESLVALHGGTVMRTKTDTRDLMTATIAKTNKADFAGDDAGRIYLLRVPAEFRRDVRLRENDGNAHSDRPARFGTGVGTAASLRVAAAVRCPWEMKGRVMRVLTKEADSLAGSDGQRVELVDGIKFFDHDDWALVLPDASEPFFHVYSESHSQESADRLLCRYVEKSKRYGDREGSGSVLGVSGVRC